MGLLIFFRSCARTLSRVWSSQGKSIRYLDQLRKTKYLSEPMNEFLFHGFDSFQGLQENWAGSIGALKGAFSLGGKWPQVPNSILLHEGFFEQTLPGFLLANRKRIAFIHLDADTYLSTSFVLHKVIDRLVPGSIVVFDEYIGFPGWRKGEFLAWQELVKEFKISYTYLGISDRGSTSLRIDEIQPIK